MDADRLHEGGFSHEEGVPMSFPRRRPSPALVISVMALFVVLGGTSYAAATKLLPKNSVGSAQVVNGSLQKSDLSAKAVRALRGAKGSRGVQGPAGPAGSAGAQGVK